MSSSNRSTVSWVPAHKKRAVLVAAPFGLLLCAAVSAAEPPLTLKYQSFFADYRRFDAQAATVPWQQANDAIGDASEGAARGTHGMHAPAEPPPADTTESHPTTSGDHREHRQ